MLREYLGLISGALVLAVLAYPLARLINFAFNVLPEL